MAPKAFIIGLLFITSFNPTDLQAQDSGCTRRTIAVGVIDSAWNPVQGLTAANFRGKVHGREVQIRCASLDTSPRRIVLLLDASGSMMWPDQEWKAAKSLSMDLIRFAPPRASIAQMAFSGTVLDTEGFEEDRSTLLKSMDALVKMCEQPRKARQTALFDAIASAEAKLGAPQFGDVIYVVTDGEDNKSRINPKKLEADLLHSGVRLFAALIAAYDLKVRSRSPDEFEEIYRLHSLVEATGGNVLVLPYARGSEPFTYLRAKTNADSVDLALHRLNLQMGEVYRIELSLPETIGRPTKLNLEVVDASGNPNRRVEVHYPQELMPCANASP